MSVGPYSTVVERPHKFDVGDLHVVLGSLMRLPRLQKIEAIEWLISNYQRFDQRVLAAHYGMMLSMLRAHIPVKAMVDFLAKITDSSVVTQGRVNFLARLYVEKMNPESIGRLLRVMASCGNPTIFIPPCGLNSALDSRIPIDVVLTLSDGLQNASTPSEAIDSKAARISTAAYQALSLERKDSESGFAESLAQMAPLVEQSGRLFGGAHKAIFEYLEDVWVKQHHGRLTQAVSIIASCYFRFWPKDLKSVKRLLTILSEASEHAADVIIPHLWHFGSQSWELMNRLIVISRPHGAGWQGSRATLRYLHIYQYYYLVKIRMPDPFVVADLIIRQKGYLSLCSTWANIVPAVSATLQGQFSLITAIESLKLLDYLFEDSRNTDTLFDVTNSAWLGSYPQRTYSRMKVQSGATAKGPYIASQRPSDAVVIISEETLAGINASVPDFFQQLVSDLRQERFRIEPYLKRLKDQ